MGSPHAPDELWTRLQRGDEAAFNAIYDLYAQRVLNHCYRRLLSTPDAEDLTAEVFAVAWRRHADIRLVGDNGGLPWLLVTANHVLSRHLLKARRARLLLAKLPRPTATDDHAETIADRLADESALFQVAAVLQRMSRRDRDVVQLCVLEGLTPSEVAAASGEPASSVRSRLSRALGRARTEYRQLMDAEPTAAQRKIAQ